MKNSQEFSPRKCLVDADTSLKVKCPLPKSVLFASRNSIAEKVKNDFTNAAKYVQELKIGEQMCFSSLQMAF